jgi:hypothetical protein
MGIYTHEDGLIKMLIKLNGVIKTWRLICGRLFNLQRVRENIEPIFLRSFSKIVIFELVEFFEFVKSIGAMLRSFS